MADAHAQQKHWTTRVFSGLLIVSAVIFIALVIRIFDMERAPASSFSWFWLFALLPGIIGLANHMVTFRQWSAESNAATETEWQHRPRFTEAFASAAVLTGIFLTVAKAGAASKSDFTGLVYAGYGAYVSTLWFMLVRLNVSALSPRFLINSAIKTAIAMLIGFMAADASLFPKLSPALYFLIGFSLSWAMKALKRSAMATFGVTQTTVADLPVRLLEGVDDGAVDVLEELGITSIQHLATMHAPEACGRSQYPRDRVLDWIDQAILAIHTNGRINEFRTLGIRSAYALITIADYACGKHPNERALHDLAKLRLDDAAQRLGMKREVLLITAECIRRDPSYIILEKSYPHRHDPCLSPEVAGAETSLPELQPAVPHLVGS